MVSKRKQSTKSERRNAKKQRINDAFRGESPVIVIPASRIDEPEKRLRVGAYCRVSSDKETQVTSFELQKHEYEEKIREEANWDLIHIYADEGLSAVSAKKRKGFQQMMQDCRDGKIDLILVKNVSRFMRNQAECLTYTQELANLSPPVGVIFENEKIDTRVPGYELQLGLYSAFAQAEAENKSQSIKWANESLWKKGIMYCNTNQFFGYTKDADGKMVIVAEEAQIIRRIYKLYDSGKNVRQIAEWLTTKGIHTFCGGKVWSNTSVRNILKNEVYCGDIIRPKSFTKSLMARKAVRNAGLRESYYYKDHHTPIIDRELWERVQEQLKYRRCAKTNTRKSLRVNRMPDTLGAFIFLDPVWDGYDLAKVKESCFPVLEEGEEGAVECIQLI